MNGNVKFYVFEKTAEGQAETGTKRHRAGQTSLGEAVRYNLHWSSLLYAIAGYLLSVATIVGEIYPFGIAYFAALAALDRRRMLLQIIPVLLGYFITMGIDALVYGAILILLLVFFTVYPPSRKKPRFILPVIVFSISIVVRGLFLVFTGISDFLLIIIFSESILAAVMSMIFVSALGAFERMTLVDKLKREEILCISLLSVSLVLGLQTIVIWEFSISEVAMRFLILAASLLGGAGGGAAAGALCGIIPSLSTAISPSAIGIFAFSGLVAGAFQRFGRIGVIVGFILGNMILSFYLINSSLLLGTAISSLLAAVLLLIIPSGLLFRVRELFQPALATAGRPMPRQKNDDYVADRLHDVGERLHAVRNVLVAMDQGKMPRQEKNIQSILRHICDKVCTDCSLKEICWESDFYQTYRDVMVMFAAVERNGLASSKDAPKSFMRRCSHSKEMVATINCLAEMYQQNDFWQRQIVSSRTLAMGQLDNTVHLLTKISDGIDTFRDFREMMTTKLAPSLRAKGLPVEQVVVKEVGERNIDLALRARRCKGGGECGLVITNTIRELSAKEYHAADIQCGNGKKGQQCYCRFFLAGASDTVTGCLQLAKAGETVCGDSKDDFLLADARHAFMISDGMGSGEKARHEADLTVELVRDVLQCGFDERFAATVVNYLLLMKEEEEIFATVDLCVVDLCQGEAEFIKLGAAPSYLCTKQGVRTISGNSMPLGSGEEVVTFREKVSRGDILVMISDGVLQTGISEEEMEVWLARTVEDSRREEPRIVAERIISGAVAFSGGATKDDMTVMATLIR